MICAGSYIMVYEISDFKKLTCKITQKSEILQGKSSYIASNAKVASLNPNYVISPKFSVIFTGIK